MYLITWDLRKSSDAQLRCCSVATTVALLICLAAELLAPLFSFSGTGAYSVLCCQADLRLRRAVDDCECSTTRDHAPHEIDRFV